MSALRSASSPSFMVGARIVLWRNSFARPCRISRVSSVHKHANVRSHMHILQHIYCGRDINGITWTGNVRFEYIVVFNRVM